MAFYAVLPKLVVMNIFMAVYTIGELNSFKFLKFITIQCIYLMTFKAVDRHVLTFKCKP